MWSIGRRKPLAILVLLLLFLVIFGRKILQPDHGANLIHSSDQRQSDENSPTGSKHKIGSGFGDKTAAISCHINEEVRRNVGITTKDVKIPCLKSTVANETYIPFSFIKKYFDIYGYEKTSGKEKSFVWSHSYSRVFPTLKEHKYDPGGSFLQFASFDVENRPRVKCVSARNGVPITTQWDKKGYYYATQICQYALAHWSKNIQNSARKVTLYEDGENVLNNAVWQAGEVNRVLRDKCVHFDKAISLEINNNNNLKQTILGLDLLVRDSPTVSVDIRNPDVGKFTVRYVPDPHLDIRQVGKVVSLGYETIPPIPEGKWVRFTRNLINDLYKGFPANHVNKVFKKSGSAWFVERITFDGVGCVTNVSLANQQHKRMFFHAADWLISTQNRTTGGWHVDITFNQKRSKYPFATELPPGWVSGMSMGHAMSVLSRAFRASQNQDYLRAAIRGLGLFLKTSQEGGFKAVFMDKFVWYEEYPTNPNSFVLNGFMYSLVGLYDLWQTLAAFDEVIEMSGKTKAAAEAENLFMEGMKSLRSMLPLFDTGSGTTYDLRHFTMGGPPKLARWDYHSTHVNLLYLLSTIDTEDDSEILGETADRWLSYMLGQRAEHN